MFAFVLPCQTGWPLRVHDCPEPRETRTADQTQPPRRTRWISASVTHSGSRAPNSNEPETGWARFGSGVKPFPQLSLYLEALSRQLLFQVIFSGLKRGSIGSICGSYRHLVSRIYHNTGTTAKQQVSLFHDFLCSQI